MAIATTMALPQATMLKAKSISAWVIAIFSALFLASCAAVPKGGTAPPPAVAATEHKIALLLPVTGPDANVGQSIANATSLALVDTKMSSIRVTTYDTALGVENAARKAVGDGNKLILGPLRRDDVVTVANIATPARVPLISFSNDIGSAGSNVFLLGHLPYQSVDRVVRYAKSNGMNRFGAIVSTNIYGQRAASDLARSVRDVGGTLVSTQETDGSAAANNAAAARLKSAGKIDAILIGDSSGSAMAIVPVLRKQGVSNAKILGNELWNTDTKIAANPAMKGAWFASVSDGLYNQYATKYRARYGTAPMRLSSLGYDSILLVARVSKNWKFGTSFPLDQLTDPEGFIGIDGAFRFLPSGVSERMLEVQEVRGSQIVTIEAAPRSFIPAKPAAK